MSSSDFETRVQSIHVVGLGVSVPAHLCSNADQAITGADVIVGSERQLKAIEHLIKPNQTCITLPKLNELKALLDDYMDQPVVILASGDPLFFGIGRYLLQYWGIQVADELPNVDQRLVFYPNVSSVQILCHRLGVCVDEVQTVSVHGRPLENLAGYLRQNRWLAVLTDTKNNPQAVARYLCQMGFIQAHCWVGQSLGNEQEDIQRFSVTKLAAVETFESMNLLLVFTSINSGPLPESPGIEDVVFKTGSAPGTGMISKREVRVLAMSLLQPCAGDLIWDIGAGCGGMSLEIACSNPNICVIGIEPNRERLAYLKQNQATLGCMQNLSCVQGRAPDALSPLPDPTKAFVGGSGGYIKEILETLFNRLPSRGVLVGTSISASTDDAYEHFIQQHQSTFAEQLEIHMHLKQRSLQNAWSSMARRPIRLFKWVKP